MKKENKTKILNKKFLNNFEKISFKEASELYAIYSQKEIFNMWNNLYLKNNKKNTKIMNDYIMLLYISVEKLFIKSCLAHKIKYNESNNQMFYLGDLFYVLISQLPKYDSKYEFSTFFTNIIFRNFYNNHYRNTFNYDNSSHNVVIKKWFRIFYYEERLPYMIYSVFMNLIKERSDELNINSNMSFMTDKGLHHRYKMFYYNLYKNNFTIKTEDIHHNFEQIICEVSKKNIDKLETILSFKNVFSNKHLNRLDRDVLFIGILKNIENYDNYTIERILNITNKKYIMLMELYPIVLKKINNIII